MADPDIIISAIPSGYGSGDIKATVTHLGEYDSVGTAALADVVNNFAVEHKLDCYIMSSVSVTAHNVSIVTSAACKRCGLYDDPKDIVIAALVAHAKVSAKADPVAIMRRHGMTRMNETVWYATSGAQFYRLCDDPDRLTAGIACQGQTAEKGRWYARVECD